VVRASTLNAAAVSNIYGQNLVYPASPAAFNINVSSPQGGNPSGTVTLTEGATTLGVGTLSVVGGVSTTSITVAGGVLNAGTHNFVFTYNDNSAIPIYDSGSKNVAQTVASAGTSVTFTPAPQTSAVYGTTVSYAGNVKTTAAGGINPTAGTVTLMDATTNT